MSRNTMRAYNSIKKSFQCASVLVGTGIAVMNLINIPNPKSDTITLRLAGLSLVKGTVYGLTVAEFGPFAIVGMLLHEPRDDHFIPGSQYCKTLRQEALTKKE